MWSHNKFGVVAAVFIACCWIFIIGPLLSPEFSALVSATIASIVVWRVVRYLNDPGHVKRPPDAP
jgi:hypothetical protein